MSCSIGCISRITWFRWPRSWSSCTAVDRLINAINTAQLYFTFPVGLPIIDFDSQYRKPPAPIGKEAGDRREKVTKVRETKSLLLLPQCYTEKTSAKVHPSKRAHIHSKALIRTHPSLIISVTTPKENQEP